MRLFVDTCVWRHWLTLKNGRSFENRALEKHATDFDQIYEIVSAEPAKHVFLYDTRIEGELPDSYLRDLPMSFSRLVENGFFERTPIPLSRGDRTYIGDGSLLAGGRFGGALRGILRAYP